MGDERRMDAAASLMAARPRRRLQPFTEAADTAKPRLRSLVAIAFSSVLLSTIISTSVLAGAADAATAVASVSLTPSSIIADGASTTTATATLTDDSMPANVAGQVVSFAGSTGQTVGTVTDKGDGTYTAPITGSTTIGPALITATVTSVTPNVSGTAPLTQTGPAAAVTVALTPASIVANGISTTSATASVTDASASPLQVAGQTVTFAGSTGQTVGPVTENADGTYSATITSSTTLGPATITATDTSVTPNLSGTATLTQGAGPPTTVTLALSTASIVADGVSTTTATATVTDGSMPPIRVAGQIVTFVGSTGQTVVGLVADNADGTYTATIASSATLGPATITATVTSASPNLTGTAPLTQTAGPPAVVAVELNPASIAADGTSSTTANATVTDAQRRRLADLTPQTLVFTSSDSDQLVGQWANAGNGIYTVQIASTSTVGTATITATAGTAFGTAPLTQTTGPPATVTVQLSPASIMANGTSTTTATANIADAQRRPLPNESVVFSSSDSNHFLGQMSNHGDGSYSVQIRGSTAVGRATISATVASRLTGQATLVQYAGPSYTSLAASPSSLVTNQGVTLVAAVGSGTGSPSGTITFKSGGASIADCPEQPITSLNAVATCETSLAASASPVLVTAVFTPDSASTAPGSTGALTIAVKPDLTSVSLAVPSSVNVGSATTYTATVALPVSRSGPVSPTGSIEFFDNGQPIPSCGTRPVVNRGATCMVRYNALSTHSITARYGGDLNFTRSTSPARTIRVVAVLVHTLGMVTSTMQWTFHYEPSYTKLAAFAVNGASARSNVVVTCRGRGCPYAKRSTAVAKTVHCTQKSGKRICPTSGSVQLAPAFRNHRLGVGAEITVTISRQDWISKYYAFTIRARRPPRILITCLVPGSTRPGVGCSP
jgi:adhesin/invasin